LGLKRIDEGDFNGDGKGDIFWRPPAATLAVVWTQQRWPRALGGIVASGTSIGSLAEISGRRKIRRQHNESATLDQTKLNQFLTRLLQTRPPS
jgi:hypothetical protein